MNQDRYHVRFSCGLNGAYEIAGDADVLVWVDVFTDSSSWMPPEAFPSGSIVLDGNLENAHAVALWIRNHQLSMSRRLVIAVVAASLPANDDQSFCAEDFLGAGAVIDELSLLGLDTTSPEAAVAQSAYRGLAHATHHLLSTIASTPSAQAESARLKVDPDFAPEQIKVLRP